MLAHELPREQPRLRVGQITRCRERPEHQIGGCEESRDPEQPDGQVETPELVAELERSRLPQEEIARFPDQRREGCVRGRGRDERERQEQSCERHERRSPERRAPSDRLVLDVEGASSPPEDTGDGEVADRLFDGRASQEVEDAERDEERDRKLERAAAPAKEVVGADQEHDGDRDREGVEDPQLLDGVRVREQVAAGRQGGVELGDGNRRAGERCDQRQGIGAAEGPQRVRMTVQAEAPGRGVPAARGQVAPVLRDQPQTGKRDEQHGQAPVHEPRQHSDRERPEHEHSEVPVVPAHAEEVHPGPERVLLDSEAPPAPFALTHPSKLLDRTCVPILHPRRRARAPG